MSIAYPLMGGYYYESRSGEDLFSWVGKRADM